MLFYYICKQFKARLFAGKSKIIDFIIPRANLQKQFSERGFDPGYYEIDADIYQKTKKIIAKYQN